MILKTKTQVAVLPLVLMGLSLAAAGCRTFNYSQEDLERERALVEENSGRSIFGGVTGDFHPGFGNFNCGNLNCGGAGGFGVK
ncbi:MAG: hypothetical protein EPO07_17720 [Verrucomicrobia bacterium]|nr:MAG: hypothetical protein EPO07_17720 [Verrucomicrobiota bacterium]